MGVLIKSLCVAIIATISLLVGFLVMMLVDILTLPDGLFWATLMISVAVGFGAFSVGIWTCPFFSDERDV